MKKLMVGTLGMLLAGIVSAADIFMAGDSTMSVYGQKAFPQQGWGQRLQELCAGGVKVHDMAVGGRSSKSFVTEGRWSKLLAALKPGDYVIIAFGHNDANTKKQDRFCTPAEFKTNFVKFAADVRAKGATPVFATSVIHSGGWDKDAKHLRAGAAGIGPYVQATREAAKKLKVDLIDLNAYAEEKFTAMGKEKADELYLHLHPGDSPNYPTGRDDKCHLCNKGALFYAQAAVAIAQRQGLSIAKLFKTGQK